LRHQLNIAMRKAPQRLRLRGVDRAFLLWMTWLWPSLLSLSRGHDPALASSRVSGPTGFQLGPTAIVHQIVEAEAELTRYIGFVRGALPHQECY
jgi:hypothetical protein